MAKYCVECARTLCDDGSHIAGCEPLPPEHPNWDKVGRVPQGLDAWLPNACADDVDTHTYAGIDYGTQDKTISQMVEVQDKQAAITRESWEKFVRELAVQMTAIKPLICSQELIDAFDADYKRMKKEQETMPIQIVSPEEKAVAAKQAAVEIAAKMKAQEIQALQRQGARAIPGYVRYYDKAQPPPRVLDPLAQFEKQVDAIIHPIAKRAGYGNVGDIVDGRLAKEKAEALAAHVAAETRKHKELNAEKGMTAYNTAYAARVSQRRAQALASLGGYSGPVNKSVTSTGGIVGGHINFKPELG